MMYFIPGVLLHPIRRSQRSVADIYLPDEDRGVVSSLILPLAPGRLGGPPAPAAQGRIQDRCTAADLRLLGLMKLFEHALGEPHTAAETSVMFTAGAGNPPLWPTPAA